MQMLTKITVFSRTRLKRNNQTAFLSQPALYINVLEQFRRYCIFTAALTFVYRPKSAMQPSALCQARTRSCGYKFPSTIVIVIHQLKVTNSGAAVPGAVRRPVGLVGCYQGCALTTPNRPAPCIRGTAACGRQTQHDQTAWGLVKKREASGL